MISVVIPAYNQARYLLRAIESVWAQEIDDLEIVVVDDGSTDDTKGLKLLEQLAGALDVLKLKFGVAFLDADDFWLPGKLQNQLNALRNTGRRFSYSGSQVLNDAGEVLVVNPATEEHGRFENLIWGNQFATPTVLAERSLFEECGLFDESLRTGEDWDLWLRFASKGPGACVAEALVSVRGSHRWQADEQQLSAYEYSVNRILARMFELASTHPALVPLTSKKSAVESWHYAVLAKSYLHARAFRLSAFYAVRSATKSLRGVKYLLSKDRSRSVNPESRHAGTEESRIRSEASTAFVPVPKATASSGSEGFQVSVVIRTYNRAAMLRDALETALTQTHPPREIVIVDDGSTDETPAVVKSYALTHPEIRYIASTSNLGPDRAARFGVEEAQFSHVAFLDSDDLWLPNHLEQAARVFEKDPEAALVFTSYGLVNAAREVLVEVVKEPHLVSDPMRQLLLKKIIVQPTRSVFRRQAVIDVGGVPLYPAAEDWVLAVLLAARFPRGIRHLNARTVFFRIHGSQSYSRPVEVQRTLLDASRYLLSNIPVEFKSLESRVVATNLLHCSIFLWQSGELGKAWRSCLRAVFLRPMSLTTSEFWKAFARLVIPPSLGRLVRQWKRNFQARSGLTSAATRML